MVICHGTRCGRSAAINAAARFASGDLLLTVDADTVFEPTAVARLAAVFGDPRVARRELQHRDQQRARVAMDRTSKRRVPDVDQRRAIHPGRCGRDRLSVRRLLDVSARTYSCGRAASTSAPERIWSTACGCAASAIVIRFVPDAWAETAGPTSGISLLRQRARWDRDALRIRFMMYGELSFFHPFERLPDTLQRLDFIICSILFPRSACRSIWLTSCCCSAPMPLCFSARSISCCSGSRSSTWRLRSSCSIDRSASSVSESCADLSASTRASI